MKYVFVSIPTNNNHVKFGFENNCNYKIGLLIYERKWISYSWTIVEINSIQKRRSDHATVYRPIWDWIDGTHNNYRMFSVYTLISIRLTEYHCKVNRIYDARAKYLTRLNELYFNISILLLCFNIWYSLATGYIERVPLNGRYVRRHAHDERQRWFSYFFELIFSQKYNKIN